MGNIESTLKRWLKLTKPLENPLFRSGSIATPMDASNLLLLDHIIENILCAADFKTVLQCRLVSKRWSVFAESQLRKRAFINVVLESSIFHRESADRRNLHFGNLPRSLSSKIKNQDKQNILGNLFLIVNTSSSFPVQNFTLFTTKLASPVFQSVLSNIGFQMKSLVLILDYSKQTGSYEESCFILCFKDLLVNQAPNIESFTCSFKPSQSRTWERAMERYNNDPNVRFFDSLDAPGEFALSKMRSFSVINFFPGKVFAEIVRRATNLKSIKIGAVEASTRDTLLRYFDKTHQQQLVIEHILVHLHNHMISTYTHLLTLHASNIKLKSFNIELFLRSATKTKYQNRCSLVLTMILHSCSKTLKGISTVPLRCLSQLEIPAMPNLRRIKLLEWIPDVNVSLPDDEYYYFFPEGFSMGSKFCLQDIIVVLENPIGISMDFLRWLDISEPVNTVKRICVLDPTKVPEEVRVLASKLFPNARFTNKQNVRLY